MSSSNSRRSSRIKLPNTQADSRDNSASYYPEDSLKLYGYSSFEPDDESDSGASSLPSSNGSTLNSSCASFDMVRCRSALESNSLSPQRRPRLQVEVDQRGLEYSKFKNDSGTFTDAEFSNEGKTAGAAGDQQQQQQQDATPTKSSVNSSSSSSSSSSSLSSLRAGRSTPPVNNSGRSTMNSVVTVIERRRSSNCNANRSPSSDRSSSSTLDGQESPRESVEGDGEAPDFSSVSSLNSASVNSLLSQHNYEFNTWDKHTIRTLGLRVREIERPPSETILSTWSDAELLRRVELYGRVCGVGPAEMANVEGDNNGGCRQFCGHLRVAVNLIRPVKLECQQQQQLLLPRGLHKRLRLTCQASSLQVVQALLRALRIKEQPYRFALYEHCLEEEGEVTFRRLHTNESPLGLAVSWLQSCDGLGLEECRSALQKRKIVLQENDSCQVNWSAFSTPELQNFLDILHREQREYEERIQLRYLLVKREIRRRVKQLQLQQQQQQQQPEGE